MSNIPHYLRLKPRSDSPEAKHTVSLIESQNETHIRFKDTGSSNKFTKIFHEISQLDLYNETLKDLTLDTLENKDSVFFTLGPSNSGKSYSTYGDDSNPGISIYALNEIFNKNQSNFADYRILKKHFGDHFVVSSKADRNCTGDFGLSISVFEIYNDRIRDLTQDSSKTKNQSLDIITDAKDGKIKPNKARQILVTNLEEAKLVLHKSTKRRAVSSTNINQASSRSHLFIHFNVHKAIGRSVRTSRLTIADLAGSERTKTAKTEGKEFKEGNYTNTSLTELGRCLALMKSKRFDRSVLRTNKLTRLLLTDLFGNFNQNKMKILLTIDPYSTLPTILHALRYIQPVSRVTIHSERNSMEPESEQILQLNEEIRVTKEKNEELMKQVEENVQRLTEQEFQIRQELSEEYEARITELDVKQTEELNNLKDKHQKSLDQKLDMLSKDYESKIEELNLKYEREKSALDDKLQETTAKHDELLNKPTTDSQTEAITKKFENKLKYQLKEFNENLSNEKKICEQAKQETLSYGKTVKDLTEKVEKLTKYNKELNKKNEELEKDLKNQKKKNKRISKELDESSSTKRKSDQMKDDERAAEENDTHKKQRKSENFNIPELKSPFEDVLMSFSPIKLHKSPSKEKLTASPSKKSKSPSKKKKSTESPKKQPLHESMFDNTLPSPKIKAKSPSKGKKKLHQVKIIDESFSD